MGRAVIAGRTDARGASEDDRWALALLPLADSLERCARAARSLGAELATPRRKRWVTIPGDTRVERLADGVQLALASLEDALAARSYRLDRPVNVPFDATCHVALATESVAIESVAIEAGANAPMATEHGYVLRTERAGLWHGQRCVREASVVVFAAPPRRGASNEEGS